MTDLGFYVHVPFCATRCGYCDFNTYTATELGAGATPATYVESAIREIELARASLADDRRSVDTVFFGGGTPTMLPAEHLVRILHAIHDAFGLANDVEVTTEANPESVDKSALALLREGGFNRMSFGMQSAREHVLAVLDRQHTTGRVQEVVTAAHDVGFDHVSVDLIYGTPGESDDDWRASVETAIDTGVDHVSAYSLIVEPATRLAARVRRGELPAPVDDVLADRYEIADDLFAAAELEWYEVSNWARTDDARCRHNLLYWTGGDWWGVGPGAHSHLDGTRWWNVKHPAAYAERLAGGGSPEQGREVLDASARRVEDVMLRIRLRTGLSRSDLGSGKADVLDRLVQDDLLDRAAYADDSIVLTRRGRLLADAVVRALVD